MRLKCNLKNFSKERLVMKQTKRIKLKLLDYSVKQNLIYNADCCINIFLFNTLTEEREHYVMLPINVTVKNSYEKNCFYSNTLVSFRLNKKKLYFNSVTGGVVNINQDYKVLGYSLITIMGNRKYGN